MTGPLGSQRVVPTWRLQRTPHPLIIKSPLCYILVLYWGDLVLGGLGGFSIRGKGLLYTFRRAQVPKCRGIRSPTLPVGSYNTPFLGYPTSWFWDPNPKIRYSFSSLED